MQVTLNHSCPILSHSFLNEQGAIFYEIQEYAQEYSCSEMPLYLCLCTGMRALHTHADAILRGGGWKFQEIADSNFELSLLQTHRLCRKHSEYLCGRAAQGHLC